MNICVHKLQKFLFSDYFLLIVDWSVFLFHLKTEWRSISLCFRFIFHLFSAAEEKTVWGGKQQVVQVLIKRQQDLSELISALLSFFISSSFYCPSNGLFITFILYKPAPVWPHYDYSTALEFQDNYELHCFNKSLGQPGSLLRLHSSQREIYEGSTSAGRTDGIRRTAGKYLYAAVWRRILESHQLSCKSGVMWCKSMQLYIHRLNKSVMQLQLGRCLLNQSSTFLHEVTFGNSAPLHKLK